MHISGLRPDTSERADTARSKRRTVIAGCALAAAAFVLAETLPGRALGQGASILNLPIDLPDAVAAAREAVADIAAVPASVAGALGARPGMPDAAGARPGHSAASVGGPPGNPVAATVSGLVRGVGAAGAHGLGTLVAPGTVDGHVRVRIDAIATAVGTVPTVDFYGDGLINFAIDGPAALPAARAYRQDAAAAGTPGATSMTAAAATAVVDGAVNMHGIALPQALVVEGGRIALVVHAEGAREPPTIRQDRRDPLPDLVAEAGFRPGGYAPSAAVLYEQRPAARADHGPSWTRDSATLFGVVPVGAEGPASRTGQVESVPHLLVPPLPAGPVTLAEQPVDPDPGAEESEAFAAAVATLSRIDSIVGTDRPTPADVCQVAGGGAGQAGCNATGGVDALAALEPAATGAGCMLTSAAGSIRLSCGGGEARAVGAGALDLPMPAIDSTTLLDMMEIWLRHPVDAASAPVAMTTIEALLAEADPALEAAR